MFGKKYARKGSGTRPSGAALVATPPSAANSLSYAPILTCRAAEEEVQLGRAGAVAEAYSTSERDEVAGRDVVAREDGLLDGDGLVETDVGVELGLDVGEGVDGAISATTTELALGLEGGRESDCVVEDTGVLL